MMVKGAAYQGTCNNCLKRTIVNNYEVAIKLPSGVESIAFEGDFCSRDCFVTAALMEGNNGAAIQPTNTSV